MKDRRDSRKSEVHEKLKGKQTPHESKRTGLLLEHWTIYAPESEGNLDTDGLIWCLHVEILVIDFIFPSEM